MFDLTHSHTGCFSWLDYHVGNTTQLLCPLLCLWKCFLNILSFLLLSFLCFFKLSSHVGAQLRRITAPCTVAAGRAENLNRFCNFEFWRILFSHLKNQYLAMSLFRRKLPTVEETYLWQKWKRKVPLIRKICWNVAHLVEISSPFLIGTWDLSSKLRSGSFW